MINLICLAGSRNLKVQLFSASAALPATATFSRPTTAWRVNKLGIVESVAADTMRLDYDPVGLQLLGALLEPAQTNMVPYSVFDATHTSISGVTFAASAATSPDATTAAAKVTESTAAEQHYVMTGNTTASFVSGSPYVVSLYAKAGTGKLVQLTMTSYRFDTQYVTFDLDAAAVAYVAGVTDCKIVDCGNGWYRLSAVFTATSAGTARFYAGFCTSATVSTRLPSYTGSGLTLYLWGAQITAGNILTSPIPTVGTAVTRAADQLTLTIPKGVGRLTFTFDNQTQQTLTVSEGAYVIPLPLNRTRIMKIIGTA